MAVTLGLVCKKKIFPPVAREPSQWALEKAKQNVLEHYLLVGVLEELEDVLLLLERLLPHFFSDVLNIYHSPGGSSFITSLPPYSDHSTNRMTYKNYGEPLYRGICIEFLIMFHAFIADKK